VINDLRKIIEGDLHEIIELDWSMPVALLSPTTGLWQTKSANDPEADLGCLSFYETMILRPTSGTTDVVHKPWVAIRLSSLTEVPSNVNYKQWLVETPVLPDREAPMVKHRIHRPPEGGFTIGFIRFYLEAIEQS
jgi:hypothetical protein